MVRYISDLKFSWSLPSYILILKSMSYFIRMYLSRIHRYKRLASPKCKSHYGRTAAYRDDQNAVT